VRKNLASSSVLCPSLLTDIDKNCSAYKDPVWRSKCQLSVCCYTNVDKNEKNVTSSKVKFPSLLTDFDQTCSASSALEGRSTCDASVTLLK
jgi:hypothetical protein